MTPDVVVDVGNSRMKWGRILAGDVVEVEYVPLNLGSVWAKQFGLWHGEGLRWAVAGSNPDRRDAFIDWLRDRGCASAALTDWKQFGVPVRIPFPERVGHDRLLNARAAKEEDLPAVIIDAGTAITVDLVDESGAFAGGTITAGVGTMARALHQFTAKLPEVAVDSPNPPAPGTSTEPAMKAGIWWSAVGGVRAILGEYRKRPKPPKHVLLSGGDAALLLPGLQDEGVEHRPYLTLEGIRLASESLP